MAVEKRPDKPERPAGATQSGAPVDPLRAAAGVSGSRTERGSFSYLVLIGIFVVVEVLVLWLMAPQFVREWAHFRTRQLVAAGKYKEAIPRYKKIIEGDPKSATALRELGTCYMRTEQYEEALKSFAVAQENRANLPTDDQGNKPEIPDFSTEMGLAAWKLKDYDRAEQYLKQGLAHNKLDKTANYYMGELEYTRGNYHKAAEYFKMVAADPGYKDLVQKYYAQIEQKLFANTAG